MGGDRFHASVSPGADIYVARDADGGRHSEEILADLGYGEAEVAEPRASRVV